MAEHRRAPLHTSVTVNVVQSEVRCIRVWKQLLVCLITRFDTCVKMAPQPPVDLDPTLDTASRENSGHVTCLRGKRELSPHTQLRWLC